jgi:hypothetical protein
VPRLINVKSSDRFGKHFDGFDCNLSIFVPFHVEESLDEILYLFFFRITVIGLHIPVDESTGNIGSKNFKVFLHASMFGGKKEPLIPVFLHQPVKFLKGFS